MSTRLLDGYCWVPRRGNTRIFQFTREYYPQEVFDIFEGIIRHSLVKNSSPEHDYSVRVNPDEVADIIAEETRFDISDRILSREGLSIIDEEVERLMDLEDRNEQAYDVVSRTGRNEVNRFKYTNPLTGKEHVIAVYNDGRVYRIHLLKSVSGVAVDFTSKRTVIHNFDDLPEKLLQLTL